MNIKSYLLRAMVLLNVLVMSALVTVPVLADGGSTSPSTRTAPSSSSSATAVPSGTKVVVLDTSGNKVPLGSQAAADIIASGDPIWCPSGVAPGGASCSGIYSSLSDPVARLVANGNRT